MAWLHTYTLLGICMLASEVHSLSPVDMCARKQLLEELVGISIKMWRSCLVQLQVTVPLQHVQLTCSKSEVDSQVTLFSRSTHNI